MIGQIFKWFHNFHCDRAYHYQTTSSTGKQKTYELEALMYRLRQINAEMEEDNNACQLIAKVNIESTPATVVAKSKLPAKPVDHNRLSTSQLYGKQGCVVLAEESSSRR